MGELHAAYSEALRGKVVLVDIWEYTCINWIRTAPFVKAWHRDYAALGLVVVGLHAPEFEFGRRADNIDRGIRDVRVVEGARLESEAGQRCRATLQRVNAYAINDLTFQAYHSMCVAKPRCSSRF